MNITLVITLSIKEFLLISLIHFKLTTFILLILITTCTFICNKDVGWLDILQVKSHGYLVEIL